jgi:hypothetical protein
MPITVPFRLLLSPDLLRLYSMGNGSFRIMSIQLLEDLILRERVRYTLSIRLGVMNDYNAVQVARLQVSSCHSSIIRCASPALFMRLTIIGRFQESVFGKWRATSCDKLTA